MSHRFLQPAGEVHERSYSFHMVFIRFHIWFLVVCMVSYMSMYMVSCGFIWFLVMLKNGTLQVGCEHIERCEQIDLQMCGLNEVEPQKLGLMIFNIL